MQTFTAGQANTVFLDVVAKASGSAITSGTVNFYLIAKDGDNAGKWFRASDSSWQAAESSAGQATYKGGAAWSLSIAAAAWLSGVNYISYAKESGNLNIVYNEHLGDKAQSLLLTDVTEGGTWTFAKVMKIINAFAVMKMQLKSGSTSTYEILDPDDETTVIAEITTNETSPPSITIKI
jgi:hypothetical protein